MQKFTTLRGIAAPLMRANIDTGAIIAPIYMLSRSIDLGQKLFANWRYDLDGAENADFVLNQPRYRNSEILIAGPNFGCGSSREGAVWALMRFGIRCVIAPSFGDIFHENAFKNGVLLITLSEADIASLAKTLAAANDPSLTVDLERCVIESAQGLSIPFVLAPARRAALLEGLDEIGATLRSGDEIESFQERERLARPWIYARPRS